MYRATLSKKLQNSLFSQVLSERRSKAGLTLSDLADLTRLPLTLLEDLEAAGQAEPSFDMCYKIGQAINSRQMQGFMIQDLWQAASMDRNARYMRSFYAPTSSATAMHSKAA